MRSRLTTSFGEKPLLDILLGELKDWQTGQHQQDAQELYEAFDKADIDFMPQFYKRRAFNFPDILIGFLIGASGPAFSIGKEVLKAWIVAREGRRVRIKKGGIEIEAKNATELDQLIDRLDRLGSKVAEDEA